MEASSFTLILMMLTNIVNVHSRPFSETKILSQSLIVDCTNKKALDLLPTGTVFSCIQDDSERNTFLEKVEELLEEGPRRCPEGRVFSPEVGLCMEVPDQTRSEEVWEVRSQLAPNDGIQPNVPTRKSCAALGMFFLAELGICVPPVPRPPVDKARTFAYEPSQVIPEQMLGDDPKYQRYSDRNDPKIKIENLKTSKQKSTKFPAKTIKKGRHNCQENEIYVSEIDLCMKYQ